MLLIIIIIVVHFAIHVKRLAKTTISFWRVINPIFFLRYLQKRFSISTCMSYIGTALGICFKWKIMKQLIQSIHLLA